MIRAKCLNVSDLIRLGETGARKSEDVLPKFGVRSESLGSRALRELRCVVVTESFCSSETVYRFSRKHTSSEINFVNRNLHEAVLA